MINFKRKNYILDNPEAGVTLMEILVVVALSGVLVAIGTKAYGLISKMTTSITSSSDSDMESNVWMTAIRRNFFVTLYDEESPPNPVTIPPPNQLIENGSSTVKYEIQADDINQMPTTIFTIKNKCVNVPKKISNILPVMNEGYLYSVMKQLNVYPECLNHLTNLNCQYGQSLYAVFSAPNQRTLNFPSLAVSSNWDFVSSGAVAGMICIARTEANYTLVQMMSATLDQNNRESVDKTKALKWSVKKMVLPPSSNGDSQYVQ